jgi:predicted nucleotidyltransferase
MTGVRMDASIADRLRSLGVSLVYLFGSVAEGMAHDQSDLDIGIVLADCRRLQSDSFAVYNELYDILTDAFPLSEIDIVFLQAAGLEVCFDAIRHGRLLFASSVDARYGFEERTMILYADFKPLLESFNDAVLERI